MKSFRNQSIITKTKIITVVTLVTFFIVLIIAFISYWLLGSRRSMENAIAENTVSSAIYLDERFRSIVESFVTIFGTDSFALEFTDMLSPDADTIQNRVIVQDELIRLASADPLIVSALIYDRKNDTTYSLFRDAIIKSRSKVLWNSEISSLSGIMILPERPSPIRGQDTIIPMAIPLSFRYGGAYIPSNPGDFIVIILLSTEGITNSLPEEAILSSQNGIIITRNTDKDYVLPSEDGKNRNERTYGYSIFMPFSSIRLSSFADFGKQFVDFIMTAAISIMLAIIAIIIIGILFSIVLRRYVTQPIGKLKNTVVEIEKGNYEARADFTGYDELGELRDAISRMAITIENQIEAIKDEQEKQTKTEMRLLTEQLTPHFLYNTLECIQQEIQNGNSGASAEMTRALSVYLRTVLSYGKETISIRNEIQHDMSYIRIMNGRFRKDISYQHIADPDMQDYEILKMILQPFIENSIKHGFGIGDDSTWVQQPEIITSFRLSDGRIRIEISDNGQGFDEAEFIAIMRGEKGEGHIGIRNTYLRLIKYYGEENVAILVSSIPYFKSTITIEFPA